MAKKTRQDLYVPSGYVPQSQGEMFPEARLRAPSARRWEDLTKEQQRTTMGHLSQHGVTLQSATHNLTAMHHRAVSRARLDAAREARAKGHEAPEDVVPQGRDFYRTEQPQRFHEDASRYGLPYEVVVAANAVTSPQKKLVTERGIQENRNMANRAIEHVLTGKKGKVDLSGVGGMQNRAEAAAELVRQHVKSGTHPLDAVDEKGKHILSGTKVRDEYYGSYVDPDRTTLDTWHGRILFPKVRSTMTQDEAKEYEGRKRGRAAGENVSLAKPKTPMSQLIDKTGVHEFSDYVTRRVATKTGLRTSELQSITWHQAKHEAGERAGEPLPLGVRPSPRRVGPRQLNLNDRQFGTG